MRRLKEENIKTMGLDQLIEKGVDSLKGFGFINVTRENIFSDEVYCFFFVRFIHSLKGRNPELDIQIEQFLALLKDRI